MNSNKQWIALFSQTGSEIVDISNVIGRFPDVVLCNKQSWEGINENLVGNAPIFFLDKIPTIEEYRSLLKKDAIITMHGWLRIVPQVICEQYDIYNGHPGLITKFPELKGKDPQLRAFEAKMKTGGCVLHKAVPEVDAGEIISSSEIVIENLSLFDLFGSLKKESTKLWVDFLKQKLS